MTSEAQNHIEISEPDLSSQIYKATYSGVPVWEFRVKNVAVMRRKTDSWLNATQILKVADFDKPHRTRILEREVQKGEHEKVQGGYGKYQGTWVPYETGVDLAERYHVKELLQPIIEFQPTSESPPLAPKHITAASNKPRKPREPKEPKPIKPRPPKKTKKVEPIEDVMEVDSDHETNEIVSVESNTNVTVSPISSLTTTPAPVDSSNDLTESDDAIPIQKTKRKRKQNEPVTASNNTNGSNRPSKIAKNITTAPVPQYQQYEMLLWSYFTTNNGTSIPDFIINPPSDFDPNIVIDQQGHTALHWAAAMANLEMTHLLSKAGSDLDRGNIHGETALMRSVMFPYNYDQRCFNDMVQILHTTIPNLDINDQTVLHHVAIFASSKGRISPSKYYMEILLSNLALHPNEEYRKAIINKQNHEGDTALNISAKYANKKLVRLLMDAGADPQIRNVIGKNAEDYILELDHEVKSRVAADHHHQVQLHNIPSVSNIESQESAITSSSITDGTTPATSGVQISQNFIPSITSILQEFENSYQLQIQEKERELLASREQLDNVSNDLNKTRNIIDALQDKIRVLPARKERINDLIGMVKERVEKRRQRRLDATISEEMKNAAPLQGGNAEKLVELKNQLNELKSGRRQLLGELIKVKTMAPDRNMASYKKVIGLFSGDSGTTSVPPQMEMSI